MRDDPVDYDGNDVWSCRNEAGSRSADASQRVFFLFRSVMSRQDGASPLHVAARNGHVEAVKELIASRADVKANMNVSRAEREGSGVGYEREQVRESKSMWCLSRGGHLRHMAIPSRGAPQRARSPYVV
jgi:ankyrin repeat protein